MSLFLGVLICRSLGVKMDHIGNVIFRRYTLSSLGIDCHDAYKWFSKSFISI